MSEEEKEKALEDSFFKYAEMKASLGESRVDDSYEEKPKIVALPLIDEDESSDDVGSVLNGQFADYVVGESGELPAAGIDAVENVTIDTDVIELGYYPPSELDPEIDDEALAGPFNGHVLEYAPSRDVVTSLLDIKDTQGLSTLTVTDNETLSSAHETRPFQGQTDTVYGTAEFPWASPLEITDPTMNNSSVMVTERTPLSGDDVDVFTTQVNGTASTPGVLLPSQEDYREPRVINVTAELLGSEEPQMGSSTGGDNQTISSMETTDNDVHNGKNGQKKTKN